MSQGLALRAPMGPVDCDLESGGHEARKVLVVHLLVFWTVSRTHWLDQKHVQTMAAALLSVAAERLRVLCWHGALSLWSCEPQ